MGNPYILWAILCLALALVLVVIEFFVPSSGLIGFMAASSAVVGIVFLFMVNTTLGLVGAIVCLSAVPFIIATAIKIAPETFVMRKLMLGPEDEQGKSPSEIGAANGEAKLVGLMGTAVTDLRPIGTCVIDGKRLQCLAASGMIRQGAPVEVVFADGMQIKVRQKSA